MGVGADCATWGRYCHNTQSQSTGKSLNDYHIYEEIGRGKQSIVYKGRRKKTIEYVAIKSVEKSQRERLMNEVRWRGELLLTGICGSGIKHSM